MIPCEPHPVRQEATKTQRSTQARRRLLGSAAGGAWLLAATITSPLGCTSDVDPEPEPEPGQVELAAVSCTGVSAWDPNQHWSTYRVGDKRTDASKLYECHTPSWCQSYPPSSSAGTYGWTYRGDCSTSCTPTTCAAAGAQCGSISNGCGSTLTCGSCASGMTCNASNQCQTTGGSGSNGLREHALVGYWHNFTNPSGCAFPIGQVSSNWDVIVVAFAENDPLSNGTVHFTPFSGSAGCTAINPAQFKADIAAKRAAGKIVALSLGGAEGTITLNSATAEANFVSSLTNIINEWGFNGIDVDLESGSGLVHGSQIQSRLVTAIKAINTNVGGNMYLSMAPEHPYVHGGVVAYSSIWGAYLPIINGLRNELDLLHVQLYNNSSVPTPYTAAYQNGKIYPEATVDNLVVSATMLIEGFTTASGWHFAGLPASKIAFGLPSGPSSSNSPVTSNATIQNAYRCITQRTNCGQHVPAFASPSFRGVMTWSINWDRHDGFSFSQPLGSFLHN